MPGGFGTLDELFEVLTLVQTGRIPRYPLILMGKDHWGGLIKWMKSRLEEEASSSAQAIWTYSHSPTILQEALEIIVDYKNRVGPPDIVPKALA